VSLLALPVISRSTTWIANDDGVGHQVIALVLSPSDTLTQNSRTFAVTGEGIWREVGTKPGMGKIVS